MDTLFEMPIVLSPRLRWIAANNILTHHAPHCPEAPWMAVQPFDEDNGKTIGECMCDNGANYEAYQRCGYGHTEDDAIVQLCRKLNIRLWNEV